jgi:hypothetical protein
MISRYGNDRSREVVWFDKAPKCWKTVKISLSLAECAEEHEMEVTTRGCRYLGRRRMIGGTIAVVKC